MEIKINSSPAAAVGKESVLCKEMCLQEGYSCPGISIIKEVPLLLVLVK